MDNIFITYIMYIRIPYKNYVSKSSIFYSDSYLVSIFYIIFKND